MQSGSQQSPDSTKIAKHWGYLISQFLKNDTKFYFKHRDTKALRQNNSLCLCVSVLFYSVVVFQNLLTRQPLTRMIFNA